MSFLKLHKLSVKNFRSVKEEQTLVLPDKGMVLVRGPSGSGKSSFFIALSYALGFNSFPATQLQSWLTDDTLEVCLDFSTDEHKCLLTRTSKSLELIVDGEKVLGQKKHVEDKLQEIIGISPVMLGALTYRPQQEPGTFLRKGDQEKKEFLSEILGLDKFEEVIECSQIKVRDLDIKFSQAQQMLEFQVKQLPMDGPIAIDTDFILQQKTEVEKAIEVQRQQIDGIEANRKEIEQLRNGVLFKYEILKNNSSDLKELKAQEQILKGHLKTLEDAEIQGKRQAEEAMRTFSKKQAGLKQSVGRLNKYSSDLAIAEGNQCPTCEQRWITQGAYILDLKQKIEATEADEVALSQLTEPPTFVHNTAIDSVRRELSALPASMAKIVEYFNKEKDKEVFGLMASNEHNSKAISEYKENISNYRLEINKLDAQLNEAARAQKEYARVKNEVEKAKASLQEAESALNAEKDFIALIGRTGFLGSIFEECLLEISEEASNILRMIPNTSNVTLEFKTESVTQKGSTKRSIVPVVTVDGHSLPLDAALSGGMRTAVRLAVDIAVSNVVSARAGINPKFLILDESFDGLGPEDVESCLELLKQQTHDKLILVVSHDCGTKEQFIQFIDVKNVNGATKVTTSDT